MSNVSKFKVGDRVVGVNVGEAYSGLKGTIIKIDCHDSIPNLVEWDEERGVFHSGGGCGKHNHCYWVCNNSIKLIENDSIVIYMVDNKVFAKNTLTGEIAKATCHEDDTFDFAIGAKLALERLMPTKSEPTYVKQDEYDLGDVVKIRDWDDIVAEFGIKKSPISDTPFINSKIKFVDGQKKYCGNEYKIIDKGTANDGTVYYHLDGCFIYFFSNDHFVGKRVDKVEKVEPTKPEEPKAPKFKPGDIVQLTEDHCGVPKGTKCEIVELDSDERYIVNFKFKYGSCHSCLGRFSEKTYLYVSDTFLEKV